HLVAATHALRADAADALDGLAARWRSGAAGEPTWAPRWARLEQAAAEALAAADGGAPFEGRIARAVAGAVPAGGTLFVSSSMPVRDLDAFAGARVGALRALGNRGASGIDGIVSTALGVAAGAGEPVVALLGDLALLHDGNGLLA